MSRTDLPPADRPSFWSRLFDPIDALPPVDRRRSRLVASMLLALTLLLAVGTVSMILTGATAVLGHYIVMVSMTAAAAVAYGLSRTRRYRVAIGLVVLALSIFPFVMLIARPDYSQLRLWMLFIWLLIPILLTSTLFSLRWAALLLFVYDVALMLTAALIPTVSLPVIVAVVGFISAVSGLFLLLTNHLRELEQVRQAELNESNRELEQISRRLEERVAERTRELALAAEVGQAVSQERDLDQLLVRAVDVVQERFGLYHVQIYLADAANRTLTLRAGTGQVGRELIQRGHHLVIGPGSINGTAAAERRPVIVPDTTASPIFRPNSLLPDTRSETAVPILQDGRAAGVLNLQSNQAYTFTAENLIAFEALAGQLAVAMENAHLFAESQKARAEIESQARRLTRQGWNEFLDGIQHDEHIGYHYVAGELQPADSSPFNGETAVRQLIALGGETIGAIDIEGELLPDSADLLDAVAQRVAQQVENLRLLGEAERYRTEAELAIRRLTRQGWGDYLTAEETVAHGYRYDGRRIETLPELNGDEPAALSRALTVQGEPIGELTVDEIDPADAEAAGLVAAVAERLSSHIENLRLTRQTEFALTDAERRNRELALINRIVSQVSSSLSLTDSMQIVANELADAIGVDQVGIALLNEERTHLTVVAEYHDVETGESAIGFVIPVEGNASTQYVMEQRRPLIITDAQENEMTRPVHEGMKMRGVQTLTILPMIVNNEVVGTVGIDMLEKGRVLTDEQMRLAETLIFQAATAVQNARLFGQLQDALDATERQAHRLALLNEMSELLNRAPTLNDIYDIAVAKAAEILPCDRVSLALIAETDDQLVVIAQAGDAGGVPLGVPQPLAGSLTERAIKAGEVLVINDQSPAGQDGINASIIAPLLTGRTVIGTLNIGSKSSGVYGRQEESLIVQLASLLSSAIENRRLLERTEQALAESQMLYDASTQLNAAATLQEALEAAVAPAVAAGASRAALWLLDLDEAGQPEWQRLAAVWERRPMPDRPDDIRFHIRDSFPLGQRWIESPGEPLIIEDVAEDERIDPVSNQMLREIGVQASVYMPLTIGRRWVGMINIRWDAPQIFSATDVRMYRSLAAQAAAVVDGRLLLQETQARAEQLRKLAELEGDLSRVADEQEIIAAVTHSLGDAVAGATVALTYVEEEASGQPAQAQVVAVWEDDQFVPTEMIPPFPALEFLRQQPRQPTFIENLSADDSAPEPMRAMIERAGIQAVAVIPLLSGRRWQGAISVVWMTPHTFDDDERFLIRQMMEPLAATVASRRAYLAQLDARRETENLYLASRRINEAAGDLQAILATVAEAGAVSAVSRALLVLFDHDDGQVAAMTVAANWHSGQERPPTPLERRFSRQAFPALELFCTVQPRFFDDIQSDERVDPETLAALQRQNTRAMAVLPLWTGGRQLGAILLEGERPHRFTERDIQPYLSLAPQVAVAVENRRLFDQARARARREQILREITAQVRSSTDVETIMRTAVRQVGQALGRDAFVYISDGAEAEAPTAPAEEEVV